MNKKECCSRFRVWEKLCGRHKISSKRTRTRVSSSIRLLLLMLLKKKKAAAAATGGGAFAGDIIVLVIRPLIVKHALEDMATYVYRCLVRILINDVVHIVHGAHSNTSEYCRKTNFRWKIPYTNN